MGYDALGIAPPDLASGLSFLLKLHQQSTLTWLSANLVDKQNYQPFFPPGIIRETGGIAVGILGITTLAASSLLTEEGAIILPWQDVLPELSRRFSQKSDLLILLSSLPYAQNKKIAATIPEIHVIIQAGNDKNNLTAQRINNSLLVKADKQGQHLGKLQINWHPSGIWHIDKNELLQQQLSSNDRLRWRLNRFYRKGKPEEVLRNNPERLKTYHRLAKQYKQTEKEIKRLRADIAYEKQHGITAATYHNSFYALKTSVPEHPAILQIVLNTIKNINKIGMKIAGQQQKTVSYPVNFVGQSSCIACHAGQEKSGKAVRHTKAWNTLVMQNQQFNLSCIACHVTGVITGEEPFALSLSQEFQTISCESCHGAGKLHVNNPQANPLPARPDKAICIRCHTPDRNPDFNYEKNIKLLRSW